VQNRHNPDCGFISQKSRDLFARFPNNPNKELFPTDKSVDRVHARWTGRARSVHHGPTPARTVGTAACSPELGLRSLQCAEARRRGCKTERGARGAHLGPQRGSSGVEEDGRWRESSVVSALGEREVELGEREMRAGRGAVKLGEGARLL
jgi:hypothetical protein